MLKRVVKRIVDMDSVRRSLGAIARNRTGFRILNFLSRSDKVYSSFQEAESARQKLKCKSHDDADLIEGNFAGSFKTRPSDYPVLFWLNRIGLSDGLKVFDFGGGIGQTYYQYSKYLQEVPAPKWIIMDLPEVIARRDVARDHENSSVSFTSSYRDCIGCNIFLAAGSLHYWERAIADLVTELGGLPQHVIINRSPMLDHGPSYFTVHDAGDWAVTNFVRSRKELENEFAQLGYEIVDRWRVLEKTLKIPLFPDYVAPYTGYYLKRQRQGTS